MPGNTLKLSRKAREAVGTLNYVFLKFCSSSSHTVKSYCPADSTFGLDSLLEIVDLVPVSSQYCSSCTNLRCASVF